jgi:hypothetical protein
MQPPDIQDQAEVEFSDRRTFVTKSRFRQEKITAALQLAEAGEIVILRNGGGFGALVPRSKRASTVPTLISTRILT